MRLKSNFCGIFATAFIVTTTFVIASCSQDDDDYDSNMYTLAEKMETRSGGDPGGEGGYTPTPNDSDSVNVAPFPKHFFLYHEFNDEEVTCYGRIGGVLYSGKVYVSGIICKDSTAEYYWGHITETHSNVVIPGGASAGIINIQAHSAMLWVAFDACEGAAAGASFRGEKMITYDPDGE